VKIPVTNTKGEFSGHVLRASSSEGIELNVTAIFTAEQPRKAADALNASARAIVSVFTGRVAANRR
jgi:transaldolase